MKNAVKSANGKTVIPALDGVRAVATIAVISFHINGMVHNHFWDVHENPLATAVVTFGGSGVTLFFVLSGFLLFMPYARALLFEERWPSMRRFYQRRALRIIPGYYAALCLMILFFQRQYLQPDHWKELALFFTFFMDSVPETWRKLNGPFWTLAVEWQFYMLLPFLALAFAAIARRIRSAPLHRFRVMLVCCGVLIVWGLFIRYVGVYLTQHPSETFHLPSWLIAGAKFLLYGVQGKYLENFAVGMIVSLCYVFAHDSFECSVLLERGRATSWWLWAAGILTLTFTAAWHFHMVESNSTVLATLFAPLASVFEWLNEMVIALGYGACLAAILFGEQRLQRPFSWQPVRWIGTISYGLYMWHLPLLKFFRDTLLPPSLVTQVYPTYIYYWLWAATVVVLVATTSYLLVEKPWIRLGAKNSRNVRPA
ncbi:acyltransferase [Reticulibacter mediterranei]|uniref:Acyltransferase n=1 Tax=Reticulibacter mediterranei TaxID=2778369 RepID=A0A8J3IH26_9CHLR|nr:acyltransferase [Reticulibacter mediterranei]GHO92398.1 acyltransferase [Reticulibacter mediterranei]